MRNVRFEDFGELAIGVLVSLLGVILAIEFFVNDGGTWMLTSALLLFFGGFRFWVPAFYEIKKRMKH